MNEVKKPMGGKRPGAGRKPGPILLRRVDVMLSDVDLLMASRIGEGNRSLGIRRALKIAHDAAEGGATFEK